MESLFLSLGVFADDVAHVGRSGGEVHDVFNMKPLDEDLGLPQVKCVFDEFLCSYAVVVVSPHEFPTVSFLSLSTMTANVFVRVQQAELSVLVVMLWKGCVKLFPFKDEYGIGLVSANGTASLYELWSGLYGSQAAGKLDALYVLHVLHLGGGLMAQRFVQGIAPFAAVVSKHSYVKCFVHVASGAGRSDADCSWQAAKGDVHGMAIQHVNKLLEKVWNNLDLIKFRVHLVEAGLAKSPRLVVLLPAECRGQVSQEGRNWPLWRDRTVRHELLLPHDELPHDEDFGAVHLPKVSGNTVAIGESRGSSGQAVLLGLCLDSCNGVS